MPNPMHQSISGGPTIPEIQLSAPAPASSGAPGAGPSLLPGMLSPPAKPQMDLDGFPVGTPQGVKDVMTPEEFMKRHPEGNKPSMRISPPNPMDQLIAPQGNPQQPLAGSGNGIGPEQLQLLQQGMKSVK